MTSNTNKKILVAGLKSGPDPTAGKGPWSSQQVLDAIKAQFEQAKQAGFDMEIHTIDLSDSHDDIIENFRAVVQKQRWDGVNIGFGVRGDESLTPLFERLVNTVVEESQPVPKFIFALRPNTVWENISRVFHVEQKQ